MAEPERTCVGCRVRAPKRDLLRLVAGPEGISIDRTATAPGRGAYVHADPACLERAVRRGGLARALRTAIEPEEVSNLLDEVRRS